ncbi:MAG TPA: hypothetical protein VER96_19990 [Polyangiaceae bacterium]|nr:hypothetical protein [Polyangiaceae bacterium]
MTESNCGRARSMCVALFALVSGLEGCVLQGGSVPVSSADDESATGDGAQGLSAYTAEYTWERKRPSRRMLSSAGNVCFLTGIHGKFKSNSEMVMISNVRGYWYVTGRSNQPGTGATARCFKYDSAKVIATRINESISGKDLDLGAHRFCALSRVSGSFESDADLVRVYQASSGHWFLQSTATSSGVNAGALCLDDDPKTPLRASRITDVAAGDIQVLAENLIPNETKPTEPLKGPACFLTGMAGKFSGEGGNVQTFVSASAKGTWNYYLRATSADAAPGVASSGACLR